jgi:hypothetical protein
MGRVQRQRHEFDGRCMVLVAVAHSEVECLSSLTLKLTFNMWQLHHCKSLLLLTHSSLLLVGHFSLVCRGVFVRYVDLT